MRWCSGPTSSIGNTRNGSLWALLALRANRARRSACAATSTDSQARRELRTRPPAALRSFDIGPLCLHSRALPANASVALSVCSIMRPLVSSRLAGILERIGQRHPDGAGGIGFDLAGGAPRCAGTTSLLLPVGRSCFRARAPASSIWISSSGPTAGYSPAPDIPR